MSLHPQHRRDKIATPHSLLSVPRPRGMIVTLTVAKRILALIDRDEREARKRERRQ